MVIALVSPQDDTPADLKTLMTKILSLKIFPPPPPATGDWKANVKDIGGEILCGQFPLRSSPSPFAGD